MKRITIYVTEDNLMAHLPDGQVKFLTFIMFCKLAWFAARNRIEVVIEDGRTK
jgi:hypothetical protein